MHTERFDDGGQQKQEEDAIRLALNAGDEDEITYRQLNTITELYYVGKMHPPTMKGVEIAADGTVTRYGMSVGEGSVKNLDLIYYMPYLEKLALVKQPVSDLSKLEGLYKLEEVNLAGSGVKNLNGLQDLPVLRELNLIHTAVKDLAPLAGLKRLEKVIVSVDMLPVKLDSEAGYEVEVMR